MKVLVISSIPWSNSNRGIDILCRALAEEGHSVTHLVFPVYRMKKKTKSLSIKPVQQIYANNILIPYDDNTMFWLPKIAMKLIHWNHIRSVKNINFNSYDLVVIESGKPLFLVDTIPQNVRLIYRQSDPVWILMKSKYLRELEERAIKKSDLVLIVRDIFLNYIDPSFRNKVFTWKNGFNVPISGKTDNPYCSNGLKKAVYVGFTPIDYKTLKHISSVHLDVEFHIIGNCLSYFEKRELRKRKNIFIHGYMTPEDYLPYVKHADFAIVPYNRKIEAFKFIGLNSKYLLFMYFNLPIVSYKPGSVEEFGDLPVLFAEDIDEFSKQIETAKRIGKVDYKIDFDYYSYEGRKKELLEILEKARIIG